MSIAERLSAIAIALLVLLAALLSLLRASRSGSRLPSRPPSDRPRKAPPTAAGPAPAGRSRRGRSVSAAWPIARRAPRWRPCSSRWSESIPGRSKAGAAGRSASPGYDRPLVPTFERRREVEGNSDIREVTADLDLPGRWHGLSVAGLRRELLRGERRFRFRSSVSPSRRNGSATRSSGMASACRRSANFGTWARSRGSRRDRRRADRGGAALTARRDERHGRTASATSSAVRPAIWSNGMIGTSMPPSRSISRRSSSPRATGPRSC